MKTLIIKFLIWGLATVAFADDALVISLTENEQSEIRQKLEAYEKGAMTLDELSGNGNGKLAQEIIAYYLSHTNDETVKMKLPISRCFAGFDRYQEAEKPAADYVQVYSNDWHGWKLLGGANLFFGNFDAAIGALTNSAALGDDGSYAPLAVASLKPNRLDVFQNIIPHLLVLKRSEPTREINPLDMVLVLAASSLKANKQDVFIQALDGLDAKQILSRGNLKQLVETGCERFKGADIDKVRLEMESATGSTNRVSSPPH
jgi:hypothetical protein